MRKRTYRAVPVKQVDVEQLVREGDERVVLGCDAAKATWYGAWMVPSGEVRRMVRWDLIEDTASLLALVQGVAVRGVTVEVAVEPTGTYADALVHQLLAAGVAVYRVNAKHAHDYQEIYDGVPSGHDAKAAAIVAKLHLERGQASRRWVPLAASRRALRADVDRVDWLRQDELRYGSRLESRLARHWPELLRWLALDSVSLVELVVTYGDPAAVAADPTGAEAALRGWSRGHLAPAKRAAVIASAAATLGVPMEAAERAQLQALGTQLRTIRQELAAATARVATQATEVPAVAALQPLVGETTAAVLYARLGDPRDYRSVRALYRAAGLNLRERSSGQKKGRLSITKRGSAVARRWLFLATLRWLQADAVARAWYERKGRGNGGVKLKAVVALMRKLLAALFHVARGVPYDAQQLFDGRRLPEAVR